MQSVRLRSVTAQQVIDSGSAIVYLSDDDMRITVLELHGDIRLLDVYDPDGNRIQLAQTL